VRLELLGDPVAHSLSPAIHNAALDHLGIDGSYSARSCDAPGFRIAVDQLRYGLLHGANVTMPHKSLAFGLADAVAESALHTGAVNTLVASAGSVRGYNTDIDGIRFAWKSCRLPTDHPVLILGAGAAAAAALVAVSAEGVFVEARNADAAADVVTSTRVDATVLAWGEPVPGSVVVNATPLGMAGERLPGPVLRDAAALLEMPYAAGMTHAEHLMREAGRPCAPGTEMLLGQAIASFTLWTGCSAPEGVMRTAMEQARNRQGGP